MKCHSKWNVPQNGITVKIKCHSKLNVTQNGKPLKMDGTEKECHSIERH